MPITRRIIRGNPYLYFQWYENKKRKEDYIGPESDPKARAEAEKRQRDYEEKKRGRTKSFKQTQFFGGVTEDLLFRELKEQGQRQGINLIREAPIPMKGRIFRADSLLTKGSKSKPLEIKFVREEPTIGKVLQVISTLSEIKDYDESLLLVIHDKDIPSERIEPLKGWERPNLKILIASTDTRNAPTERFIKATAKEILSVF
jgi:hypothetical protein